MSVCPIGLAIVLGVCGAPRAQQPAPPKAPAAIVERSERPANVMEIPRVEMSPEEAKRNGKPSKLGSNGTLGQSGARSRQRRPATAGSCLEKSCPQLKPPCHHPDS